MMKKILDLGCGLKTKIPGSIGVDKRPAPHVDIIHDLNTIPYPFMIMSLIMLRCPTYWSI
jgi:hypothetical protein